MSAQQLAEATARAIHARDRTAQALGIEVLAVRPGYARVGMRVRDDMMNGQDACHGGMMFTLADSAFGYACNSHNHTAVAAGCTIEFLAPAREGDRLIAEAVERVLAGRSGVYDVTLTNQHGQTLALFRGKSTRIRGAVIDPMRR